MQTKTLAAVPAVVVAAIGLAACGGSDSGATSTAADATVDGTSGSTGGTVKIAAEPDQLAFTQKDISAPAGTDTIEFDNPSSTAHNVQIEDSSGAEVGGTDTISSGKTSTTADLQPGTYTFFCSVDGHEAAGMKGTLTVD